MVILKTDPASLKLEMDQSKIAEIGELIWHNWINKGIEFIALPSIFRDTNLVSSIPSYFVNTEFLIICYTSRKHTYIILTPLKPHFYIVNWGI